MISLVPHSWPWMVWLNVGISACGGTLIGDQHVLTAAHCTEDSNLNNYRVFVGAVEYGGRVNGNRVRHLTVSKRYQHESYNKANVANDISILKLSERVPMGTTTGYVCLPSLTVDVNAGDIVEVTGWGRTNGELFNCVCIE